jgi:RNA polymerase sigma factor (sigma-70 family)
MKDGDMATDVLDDTIILAAQNGDAKALEDVVRHVQDRVHRLAIRMMYDPEHSLDATQEILIRVVTKLSTFRGESSFETWVYRVATNYLLTARKVIAKDPGLTFDIFQEDLENGLVEDNMPSAEDQVMLNEVRINCTMAMLLCLDRDHRIAYVLGDILEFDQAEAVAILGISKDNYRKRLSRARQAVIEFTSNACGLANSSAKCHCSRRLPQALKLGRVSDDPARMHSDAPDFNDVRDDVARVQAALVAVKLQRATGELRSSVDIAARIHAMLEASAP